MIRVPLHQLCNHGKIHLAPISCLVVITLICLLWSNLIEENYNTWSREVLISLDAKTKLGFIDGTIPKPQSVNHPYYTAWHKCNNTILAWLFNSISKDLQPSVVYFKTTMEVWVDL